MTGHSGTPLAKKLGLKDGQRVAWINRPAAHDPLTTSRAFIAVDETTLDHLSGPYDVVHMFTDDRATFEAALPQLLASLDRDGMIWISWPKKASKVPTDMSEDVIRNAALKTTLVDVKVCAVDKVWSGLKLVIRKEHRAAHI
ncbi:DUF3052 domain-containing protein [Aliiroseovarius crassostreae]|uniref:DUF3052 domain-containing protein n=1 Tax=Aliiroseovarius crassostreae TaxID=154981 RepID=UPI0021FAC241|nr:DUF3052 domain-containing protein [Aliiroseovarius crassostreae]UWQ11623.1 DUF3052 domain-containing protein [Aliiroseovarius crassostreae]